MRTQSFASRRTVSGAAVRALSVAVLLALASVSTYAQTESVRDGSTPSALTAGTPAGSYSLSGFETVNPYNGGLNFSLPLLKIGGRGEADYAITLRIDQKWSIRKEINPGHSANYYPTPSWNDPDGVTFLQTYSVGKLTVRHGASRDFLLVNGCGYVSRVTLTRLTFTAPDGTEYELRDAPPNGTSQGAPHVHSTTVCEPQYNRGKVFVTADGTSATFISDADITDPSLGSDEGIPTGGTMILKDGTRFRIGNMGNVDWMRDRNGNLTTFTYGYNANSLKVTTVTDSLGRQVTITESSPVVIAYKGFGGADRTVKIYMSALGSALRSDFTPQTQNTLFPGINNPVGTGLNNPTVISSVELPDLRTYQFKYNSYGELARVVLPTGGAFEYDYAPGLTDNVANGMFTDGNNEKQVYRRIVERREYSSGGNGSAYSLKQVYSRPESSTTHSDIVEVQQCTSGPSVGACSTGAALLSRELHYYNGSPRLSFNKQPYEYTGWQEGKEYRSEVYDPQTGALLRKVETTWQQPVDGQTWPLVTPETNGSAKPNSPQVTQVQTTLADTNQVSKQTYAYDQYGNKTDTYEYDFGTAGSGQAGSFVRRTHTDFVVTSTYVNADVNPSVGASLRGLPKETWVSTDVAGADANKVSRTSYLYDQSVPTDPGVATGHDAAYGSGFTARGNLTSTTRYLNPASSSGGIATTAAYDVAGNVVSATDPNGNTSTVSFADSFCNDNGARCDGGFTPNTFAFPTRSETPPPGNTAYGSTSPLVTTTIYDFYTGLVYSTTDHNNRTTTLYYKDALNHLDPLDRLKAVVRPDGGRTDLDYGDTVGSLYVHTLTDLDSSRRTETYQYFDGLGRAYRKSAYENSVQATPWLNVDMAHDALGRVFMSSMPYRSAGGGTPLTSTEWLNVKRSEITYDALGRVLRATTQPYGAYVQTDYSGNRTLVKDQMGKERLSRADALGRLTEIWEVTPLESGAEASTVSITAFPGHSEAAYGYLTSYKYDALNNLRMVEQLGQHLGQAVTQRRFFAYDSLGRLVRAKSPEQGNFTPDGAGGDFPALTDSTSGVSNSSWSAGYLYDQNGNLLKRREARGVTASYGYDALNRNTTVRYTLGGGAATTPDVNRYYDNPAAGANGLGRAYWTETVGVSATVFDSYDAMGRPTQQHRNYWVNNTWGSPFSTAATYNKAGKTTSLTYPSTHSVSYNYDAAGRLADNGAAAAFAGNLGDGAARSYASEIRYHEMGGMEQERFGTDTPVYNKSLYNSRGQRAEIRVSTYPITAAGQLSTDWNRGAIINHYSLASGAWGATGGGTDNNGNLRKQDIYIPNTDDVNTGGYSQFTQFYDYDALNRLYQASESFGSSTPWVQYFNYDRWSNRTVNASNTTGSAPEPQFTVDASTDRLGVPTGQSGAMSYDAAGNLTNDTYQGGLGGGGTRAYDAENRMTSAQFVSGQTQTSVYTYDADGRRVKRKAGAGDEVWQVYGVSGELLAEYAAGASPNSPQKEYGYRAGELLVTAEAGTSGSQGGATVTNAFVTGVTMGALRGDSPGWTGTRILTGSQPVTVSSLGRMCNSGNSQSHDLKIVRASDNVTVAAATVAMSGCTVNQFKYAQLSSPVTLSANTNYYVVSYEVGGDLFHDWTGTWLTTSSVASVTAAVYTTDGGQTWGTPTGSGNSYVPVGFEYQTPAPQPLVTGMSLGAGRADSPGWTGTKITVGSQALTVTNIGRLCNSGNSLSHDLKIVRASDNVTVAAATVAMSGCTVNQFKYAQLSSPVTLAANTGYYVVSYEVGGDLFHDWTGTWLTPTSAATFNGAVYTPNGGQTWNVPTGAGNSYVPVDIEYMPVGTTADIRWLVADQLGTPRMVIDKTGSLAGVTRHDYLPFGEELGSGIGGRTATQGYSAVDKVRQKFASYERDVETGLDYAKARYYSSTMGRYAGVDPIVVTPERFFDPQQLNLYAYARNNPLKFIDPTGEALTISGNVDEIRRQLEDMVGTEDAAKRISFDEKTGTITVDLTGIDLSTNEGAALLNDAISSKNVYDVSVGSSVESLGGQLSLTPTKDNAYRSMVNLDNNPDDRFKKGKSDNDKPKKGVDDQIGINFDWRNKHSESNTKLSLAPDWTTTFHELAEAYAKVEHGKQYAQAHQEAIDRETKLRDQRPYLKDYNPGSGPGTNIIIKNK